MRFSSILSIFLISFCLTCCKNTNEIYIVRHAEKGIEPAYNPPLTAAGKQRAELLKDILKDKGIKAIYSTKTTRTTETAMPLSRLINVPVENYGVDTLARFLQHVISSKKNALIVGHSNTIIPMLDGLSLLHTTTNIADSVYNNIFIIRVKDGKAVKIKETSYEALTPAVK
jgi:phosphohistidine phosphatase SixA